MSDYFVGGSIRAGTTLLQSILCTDPTTNPLIYEAYLFRMVVEAYKRGKAHFAVRGRDYFSDFEAFQAFHREWQRAFLENTRRRHAPARHLVLKEPSLTTFFPELHELFPEARFLVIVRDPRDAVASMVEVGQRMEAQGRANLMTSRDMRRLARQYASYYAPVLKARAPGFRRRLLFVRYEDLVRDTAAEVERIRRFTGLALEGFDPQSAWARKRIDFAELEEWALHRPWASALWDKGLSAARVGRYREILDSDEVKTLEDSCSAFLRLFRYAT